MRKKLLTILISVSMCVTMMPAIAFATEEQPAEVQNNQQTESTEVSAAEEITEETPKEAAAEDPEEELQADLLKEVPVRDEEITNTEQQLLESTLLEEGVTSSAELEAAINVGQSVISIAADFELDRTFYIASDITITSASPHVLTRAAGFGGDIFVVGEKADGTNLLLKGIQPTLTIGDTSANTLTLDGNKSGMTAGVTGSLLFICNSSSVVINSSAAIQNFSKTGNSRAAQGKYYVNPNAAGGPVAIVSSGILRINGGSFDSNEAPRLYGGVIYNNGSVDIYGGTFTNNSANRGGVFENNKEVRIKSGSFENNTAVYGGVLAQGASEYFKLILGKATGSTSGNVTFSGNSANAGGALFMDTNSTLVAYENANAVFSNNKSTSAEGGAIFSRASIIIKKASFSGNSAATNGGAIFMNSGGLATPREAKITNVSFSGNTAASGGGNIYGNAGTLHIASCTTDGEPLYAGTIAADDNVTSLPPVEKYGTTGNTKSVKTEIFDLAASTKNLTAKINTTYGKLPKLENKTNFQSKGTTTFKNINGKTVTVDSFVYYANKSKNPGANVAANNPNVGEGLLIYQAMAYKKKYPSKAVSIDMSMFRFSTTAAVCINRKSRYFGYMRNLADGVEYDKYGFVKISYLLIEAAKMGIDVTAIGQIDDYSKTGSSATAGAKIQRRLFADYFYNHMNDACDPAYAKGKTVKDYLNFRSCLWTSYNDNGGSDMLHIKVCAVSNYLDSNGVAHSYGVYNTSMNLDGILSSGVNDRPLVQTATIISGHEKVYKVTRNVIRLMAQYCGQEDIKDLRELMAERTSGQLRNGGFDENNQIVYTGTSTDKVFEVYFAPFGEYAYMWNENSNPFCKYLRKLNKSGSYIWFSWDSAKFQVQYPIGKAMESMVNQAFTTKKNSKNRLAILLDGFDTAPTSTLKARKDYAYKSIITNHVSGKFGSIHTKDMQLSYTENGKRVYVSLLNSLNIHEGSAFYQTNHAYVIKESNGGKGSVFYNISTGTNIGIADKTLATGTVFTKGNVTYKVTGKTTVNVIGIKNVKTVTIPATVSDTVTGSCAFSVTGIANNSFKGKTKLRTLTIKSKALVKAKLGKTAFKGVSAKVKVKVAKAKLKTYTAMFRAKGLIKKVKVVKF